MDKEYYFENAITPLTNGLDHEAALELIGSIVDSGLISQAYLIGYKDAAYSGVYDKYWRYSTHQEDEYLAGSQAAMNNGAVVDQMIEVAENIVFSYGARIEAEKKAARASDADRALWAQ